jgi:hypothetical protein
MDIDVSMNLLILKTLLPFTHYLLLLMFCLPFTTIDRSWLQPLCINTCKTSRNQISTLGKTWLENETLRSLFIFLVMILSQTSLSRVSFEPIPRAGGRSQEDFRPVYRELSHPTTQCACRPREYCCHSCRSRKTHAQCGWYAGKALDRIRRPIPSPICYFVCTLRTSWRIG